MPPRGNKPVGRTARILLALSVGLILILIAVSIYASGERRAYPARGAASLPGQAAEAGAEPGQRPAAQ